MESSDQSATVQRLKRSLIALEKMQSRILELEGAAREPVAIVGLGVRMPGEVDSPAAFWQLLSEGIDATSEVPLDRWDSSVYYDPDPDVPGKMYTQRGAFVSHLRDFDAQFFRISPREALSLDPQQRLVLEVSWEALEDAGTAPESLAGSSTGVFLGIASTEYFQHLEKNHHDENDIYVGTGNTHSAAAGRVSFILGLQGPSVAIDTACSSSLVSVHLACQSLRNRECDLALAGGVNRIVVPQVSVHFSKVRALSRDGRSKTFDASADGYGRGEGCGFVVLKRLSDAIASGDNIRALILGSAVNHDGISSGLTVPNGGAQQAVIRKALGSAHVRPEQVSYVEAHGTGTPLGDPIEIRALQAVYGGCRSSSDPLLVGSVKTNIGHLEPAAGIAGLIKTALALEQEEIPPHLHLNEPNPHIPWDEYPILIPRSSVPWPARNGERIAGVSAFGFSGTNAHVILQSFQRQQRGPVPRTGLRDRTWHLLALSAKTEKALNELIERYRSYLETEDGESFADVCFTANAGRNHFQHRVAFLADTRLSALEQIRNGGVAAKGNAENPPRIAFLFTGQGAQYAGMGRELYETEQTFRQICEQCDAVFQAELNRSLIALLYGTESDEGELQHTTNTQPALFMLEYALARLWQAWGIEPVALLGHSIGEFAAACIAEVFTLRDALRLVAARGRLMGDLPGGGGMAAVLTDEATVRSMLRRYSGELSIAAVNGPLNTVISGRTDLLDEATSSFTGMGIIAKRLNVSHAFHSSSMDPMLSAFRKIAGEIAYSRPKIAIVSNVSGEIVSEEMASPDYWTRQLREPVQFARGMTTLSRHEIDVFLETGPAATLLGLGRQCLPGRKAEYLPSLAPGKSDWQTILKSLATFYARGYPVNWAAVDKNYNRRRVVLPTYPFQRQTYWIEAASIEKASVGSSTHIRKNAHPLLGRRVHRWPSDESILFENHLREDTLAFLGDHRIHGTVIAPAAGFVEMALSAAQTIHGGRWKVEGVNFEKALVLTAEEKTIQVALSNGAEDRLEFAIVTCRDDDLEPNWVRHVSGSMTRAATPPDWTRVNLRSLQADLQEEILSRVFYAKCRERGIEYGPAFQGLNRAWRLADGVIGHITLPTPLHEQLAAYYFHPALLDACLQPLGVLLETEAGADPWIPLGIEQFTVLEQPGPEVWSYVRRRSPPRQSSTSELHIDALIFAPDGRLLAFMENLRAAITEGTLSRQQQNSYEEWFYDVEWRPQQIEAEPDPAPTRASAADIAKRTMAELPEIVKARPVIASYLIGFEELEKTNFLFVLDAFHRLGAALETSESFTVADLASRLAITPRHLRLFARLLEVLTSNGLLRQEGERWVVLRPLPMGEALPALRETVARYPAIEAEATLLGMCAPHLAEVLNGGKDPLQLLFPGGDLTAARRLYHDSPGAELMNELLSRAVMEFVETVHADQRLRVIEIGGGTGATTSVLLPRLPAHRTEYLFTDVSPLFVARMKRQFGDASNLSTAVFDVEEDPRAQGLSPGNFDIVIAAQVLHATEDLARTLTHVQRLLSPEGLLVMLEPTTSSLTAELASGLLPGWWKFSDFDLRPSSPLLSSSRWQQLLSDSGFEQVATINPCEIGQTAVNAAVILAQLTAATPTPARSWIIFQGSDALGQELVSALASRGDRCVVVTTGGVSGNAGGDRYEIDWRDPAAFSRLFAEVLHPDESERPRIVYLGGLDVEASSDDIRQVSRDVSVTFLNLVKALANHKEKTPPKLWVVTRGAIPLNVSPNPASLAQSALWGVGKVAALEHPELNCVLIDLDPAEGFQSAIHALLNELGSPSNGEQVAIRQGERFVARLSRSNSLPEFGTGISSTPAKPQTLTISSRGTPSNLRFEETVPRHPGPREAQVKVKATGLNFADVMDALGLLPFERNSFGVEFAGEVTKVGKDVSEWKVGDRVFGAARGSFDSYVTVPLLKIRKIPQSLSFADAATLTVAFATAYYSLHQAAGIKAGDRILIHAAAGGVGLAAVQLAQLAGAQIFATAHPAKWQRLRELGVEHCMNSRTTDFAEEILALTKGEGVDIVLNSLTGDAIPKGLGVLRPGGRFIEIGKRDLWTVDRVSEIKSDIQYDVVDLLALLEGEDDAIDPALDFLVNQFEVGRLRPLPHTDFPLAEVVHAFRYMQQARHFGKVVLVHPEDAEASPGVSGKRPAFREEASYLITGGMGGLGLAAAEWLVTRGARHVALMGRRAPTPEGALEIRRLEAMGARVLVIRGDVARDEDVSSALRTIKESLPALRGIIHSAAVLDDSILLNQTAESFDRVFAPKVDGAWSLHSQTRDLKLDFFLLFSAGASLLGSRGQANYVAANAFLDSLAYFRRQQGFPAISINWGPWAEVGLAAARGLDKRAKMQGIGSIERHQGIEILDRLYQGNPVQVGVLPIQWAEVAQHFAEWPLVSGFRGEALGPSGETDFHKTLLGLPLDEKRLLIAQHIRSQMAAVLGLNDMDDIGVNQGFFELGMDSLTAVELRNRLQASLGFTLSPTLAFDYPTVGRLIDFISRQVFVGIERGDGSEKEEKIDLDLAEVLAQVEQLSDDDVLTSLRQKR